MLMKFEQSYTIGSCCILPAEFAIEFEGGEKESLQPKFVEVLNYLAENYPKIIPREELIEHVWQGNTYVGEKALTNTIWHLRKKLNNKVHSTEVIGTVRKVGYRLLVEPQLTVTAQEKIVHLSPQTTANIKPENSVGVAITGFSSFKVYIVLFLSFVMALAIAYYVWTANPPLPLPEKLSPIQTPKPMAWKAMTMTKLPGAERYVSPSSDGRYFIFQWFKPDGSRRLYLQDAKQLNIQPAPLTQGSELQTLSVWGDSGENIYFASLSNKQCHIVKKNLMTHVEEIIAQCAKGRNYSYGDISPDGKTLAFTGHREPEDDSGIYFIALDEGHAKPIRFSCANNCGYKDRDFSFAPDGKHIAVSRRFNRFNENIFLVNLENKSSIALTEGEEDIVGLTWLPDGEHLIYATQLADVRKGVVLNIKTRQKQSINLEGFSFPSVAKNTGELYFQQHREEYFIAQISTKEGAATSPFPVIQSEFNHHFPHYSPLANKLAYVSNESGHYELWSGDSDGQNRQQLTRLENTVRYPRWSHDGKKIAFLAASNNRSRDVVYIYDLDKQSLSPLKTTFEVLGRPTWSMDDKAIISAASKGDSTDLFWFSLGSNKVKRLTNDGGRYGVMTSPNILLYTNLKDGLWQKNIESSGLSINKISRDIFTTLYSWDAQPDGVYFRKNEKDYVQLSFYDFGLATVNPLLKIPKRTFESYGVLTYIPRASQLLFTFTHFPQSDIKKVDYKELTPFIE